MHRTCHVIVRLVLDDLQVNQFVIILLGREDIICSHSNFNALI